MKHPRPLAALSDTFQGRLREDLDWVGLVNVANEALVTPSLHRALIAAGVADQIPANAAAFFDLVDQQNQERNARLQSMAQAAVAALNSVGIAPVPLKGLAVAIACYPTLGLSPRMMSDIDLLVRPADGAAALSALGSAGFQPLDSDSADSPHIVAELWRDGDVGVLDLHCRQPGMPGAADVLTGTTPRQVPWLGEVHQLSPTYQTYLTCLHDLFHDGGFWSGGYDVRHLCDIAELAGSPDGVDWRRFDGLLPSALVRNAVHSQLIAAHRIAGAAVPIEALRNPIARLHHARFMTQVSHPGLYLPLRVLSLMLKACNRREAALYGNGVRPPPLLDRALRVAKPPSHPNRI